MKDFFSDYASKWDTPRRREMAAAFVAALPPSAAAAARGDVLDFGCGTGLIGLSLAPAARGVVLNDTSPAMLTVLREKLAAAHLPNVTLVAGGLAGLPDESFDLIISNMAFHHVADIPAVLAQFRRLCRPGGRTVISDLMTEDGSFHAPAKVPHNGFDPEALGGLFSAAGFTLAGVRPYRTMRKPGVAREFRQFLLEAEG